MRFVVDECTGPILAKWLRNEGHDVFSVFDQARGLSDDAILNLAVTEKRILITNDKDFGEMAYRSKAFHYGIILLRLDDERSQIKINVVSQLLKSYKDLLHRAFVVVNEDKVRFAHGHNAK
jgi:predicted nuclease of predicted toxin-antitoxin system